MSYRPEKRPVEYTPESDSGRGKEMRDHEKDDGGL